jgi:hypothetical protein
MEEGQVKHKFTGLPSCDFVRAALRKYVNQRAAFELVLSDKMRGLLSGSTLDLSRPIMVNAVFRGVWKKPVNGSAFFPGPMAFKFRFSGAVFIQDDVRATLFSWRRRLFELEFDAEEIGKSPFTQWTTTALLAYNGGGV